MLLQTDVTHKDFDQMNTHTTYKIRKSGFSLSLFSLSLDSIGIDTQMLCKFTIGSFTLRSNGTSFDDDADASAIATIPSNIHRIDMRLQWIVIDSIRNNACVHINIDTLTS